MTPPIFFDIETAALPKSIASDIMPEFEASKVLKDPEKIKSDIAAKEAEWLDKGALHAERGCVVAIGYMVGQEFVWHHNDEKSMIQNFWNMWTEELGRLFVGHNIKSFDVPFLVRRSWILGIPVPLDVMDGRYVSKRFRDTMEAWACGTRDMISLDTLAWTLGCGRKNGSGADFAKLLKEDVKKAEAYLRQDLLLTRDVAGKMGIIEVKEAA